MSEDFYEIPFLLRFTANFQSFIRFSIKEINKKRIIKEFLLEKKFYF